MDPDRPIFEVRAQDVAGRLGELEIPRSGTKITTPAIMPVVNPHLQTIEPASLAEDFGAEILITNAYILSQSESHRSAVLDRGLHEVLDFDGAIMTDSGSFQLAEYGEIDVTSHEILSFQRAIGSDIATPIDIPTPPDATRHQAVGDLAITDRRIREASDFDRDEMLLAGPIQGSRFPRLREKSARDVYRTGLDIYPIGAVVPLLNRYRFATMVDVIAAAKRGLGTDAPVHLFGAGHPMMFSLAVALGCDLFDSAAYAIYARDRRYLTVRGTRHIESLQSFPCPCSVCTAHDPQALAQHPDCERLLSIHNLHVTFAEIRRIRAAIADGTLLELVEDRARAHPAMLSGYRRIPDHVVSLERHDPASKGTFFYLSAESANRPEVSRHHDRLARISGPDNLLLVGQNRIDHTVTIDISPTHFDEWWPVVPPFGPVPFELRETYPVNAELPESPDLSAYTAAVHGIVAFEASHPETTISFWHPGWPSFILDDIPETITVTESNDSSRSNLESNA